eukprot:2914023-Rhodomonas_salina.1
MPLEKISTVRLGADGVSAGVRELFDHIYQKVQVEKQSHSYPKTVFFGGEPTTLMITSQPIRVRLPGMKDERVLSLESYNLADSHAETDNKTLLYQYRLSSELLYNVETKIQCFSQDGAMPLTYRNQKATSFYQNTLPPKYGFRQWLDKCRFEGIAVRDRVLEQMKTLSLGNKPLDFEYSSRSRALLLSFMR